ncbi:MAG: lasso RiPP family leader peptide-containing protein [Acidobacteria bacterium]|nr:lasso RiPP family leader peptide-containing protein [Acidobacteriota bacterium]
MTSLRRSAREGSAAKEAVAARSGPGARAAARRRAYVPPRLEDYGDLRDLTLGGSPPGVDDSAFPNTRWR